MILMIIYIRAGWLHLAFGPKTTPHLNTRILYMICGILNKLKLNEKKKLNDQND